MRHTIHHGLHLLLHPQSGVLNLLDFLLLGNFGVLRQFGDEDGEEDKGGPYEAGNHTSDAVSVQHGQRLAVGGGRPGGRLQRQEDAAYENVARLVIAPRLERDDDGQEDQRADVAQ